MPRTPPATDPRTPGLRLRGLRLAQGLTLKGLSARSGVALSTLSKIELGQVAASYSKFLALARALGVDIAQLFGDEALAPAPTVAVGLDADSGGLGLGAGASAAAQPGGAAAANAAAAAAAAGPPAPVLNRFQALPGHDAGPYRYQLLGAGFAGRRMTPMHGLIRARRPADIAEPSRHPGQEFITVLRGRIRILFETGAPLNLGVGESAYFDSGVAHAYLSTGRGDAQVLVVMCD